MTIGENIQTLRKSRGLSQEALAAQLRVSRQAVSKWECGEYAPDAEKLLALSDILGVSCDAILRGPDFPLPPAPDAPAAAPAEKPKAKGRAKLVCGIVFSALGALGFLLIAVLSTMIKSQIHYSYQDDLGKTWYTTGPGYSLSGFIEFFRLKAVVALLGVSLFVGLCLLCAYLWARWDEKHPFSE